MQIGYPRINTMFAKAWLQSLDSLVQRFPDGGLQGGSRWINLSLGPGLSKHPLLLAWCREKALGATELTQIWFSSSSMMTEIGRAKLSDTEITCARSQLSKWGASPSSSGQEPPLQGVCVGWPCCPAQSIMLWGLSVSRPSEKSELTESVNLKWIC